MKRFFKKVRTFTNDLLYKRDTTSCIIMLLIIIVPGIIANKMLENNDLIMPRRETLLLLFIGPLFFALLNCIARLYLAIKSSKEQGISIKEAWEQS
ncbi:MAG: hypothetical protein HFJ47_02700 [Clostridia bacterium]|nr:hypothetical protein [Clostridia bacterium]